MDQIKLFYSYSQVDETFREELEKSLVMLKRYDALVEWHFRKIPPGKDWDKTIKAELENADIILLLISRDFLASDYCYDIEVKKAMEMHESEKAIVIPIILRECDWKNKNCPFKKLEGLPKNALPISQWTDKDSAYNDIVQRLKDTVEEIKQKKLQEKGIVSEVILSSVSINKLSDAPKSRPYFTGRDKEIEEFKKAIDTGNTFIAIDGAGGIGKTQFISRCIEKYIPQEKIIWFNCQSTSQLDTLISEAGYPELLKGSSKTDREKFSAFKDKIQENEFVLFLDNFQETNNTPVFREFLIFIQDYLKKGCVVVIDRDDIRNVNLTPKRIHIEGFKEKKLEYAKVLIAYSYKDDVNINDSELESLCEKLQGYPLAIDFAINLLSQGETSSDIITKIVQEGDVEQISERLLNAIFSRPDATLEEKDFIRQFSVFTGSVPEQALAAVIPDSIVKIATKKLQRKNLLSHSLGNYEIHPLVREFCYKELTDKESVHAKVAEFYIQQRLKDLSPLLEEQIFYHLTHSNQWERIESEIEEKGSQFILLGQLGLVKELLDKLKNKGISKPIFNIFYGDISQIEGEWEEAQKFFNSARLDNRDKKIRAQGLIKYGEMEYRKGNVKESIAFFEEGYEFSNQNNFLKEEARALHDIGLTYEFFGDLDYAIEKYNNALKIRKDIGDKEGIAISLNNIGSIYEIKGELDEGLSKIEQSLKIQKEIGDKSGQANSLSLIGHIFFAKGKLDKALTKYEESFEIEKERGDKQGIAVSLGNKANIFLEKQKYDDALRINEEKLRISKEIGSKSGIASTLGSIGLALRKKNKLNEALIKYEEGLLIHEEIGNKSGIASTSHNIGVLYTDDEKKNFDLAIVYLFKALSLNNKMGAKPKAKQTIDWLVNIRDKKIGLEKFKIFAKEAYLKISDDLKPFIPLKELCKEPITTDQKVGRNDPCPCGSGKKYKSCHGKND